MATYKEAPVATEGMPKGVPYIVGNEAAERFSYYGMKTILVVFMTQYLAGAEGGIDPMVRTEAVTWYHTFTMANYAFPILGAIFADWLWGKYRTIIALSVVYCLGHLALALDETRMGLSIGLTLIAIGSGGIKPCVSAHVGDQFGATNAHLLEKVFGWFYFAINLGAFASSLLTPILLDVYGPHVAFGLPGALMLLATIVFWMGRHEFVHIPPKGAEFFKEAFSKQGLAVLGSLAIIYAFVAMFWALFDQTGSTWVLQAQSMDRHFLGVHWLESQIQAINPILVMALIPITAYGIYPLIDKFFPLTPLRKISIGFFLTVPAFLLPAWVQTQIDAGLQPNIGWQLVCYLLITLAEVFVSITALEFSYTQAPNKMKSLVMGLFLCSVALGNAFTAGVNIFIQEENSVKADLTPAGTLEVKPEKNTTYALSCQADGADPVSTKTNVDMTRPKPPPPEEGAEKKEEAPKVTIKSFTANGSKRLILKPGGSVELKWETDNAEKCVAFLPKEAKLETNGTKTIKPEKTRVYVLRCTKSGAKKAQTQVEVIVTDGLAIRSFSASAGEVKAGTPVMLKWDAQKAKKCQITAKTLKLEGADYYLFFAAAMFITAILFIFVAVWFEPKAYVQEEEPAADSA